MSGKILTRWAAAAAILGLAAATGLIAYVGLGEVLSALARIGWRGLAVLVAYSALPFALLGSAWFSLERPWSASKWRIYLWARMVRDAGGELLPFSHVGGLVIGVRAATLSGISATWASATTIVDVTAEIIAQIAFTCLGLALLLTRLDSGAGLVGPVVGGLVVTIAAVSAFIVLQRQGIGPVTALVQKIMPAVAPHATETGDMIAQLHRQTGRFSLAIVLHLAAWVASGLGAWLALKVAGVEIGAYEILGLEALVMAVRSAAFVAPMGVGVQEASYVFLGPLFGLGPDVALALSLIKRARELAVGLPVLIIWQAIEGRRLVRRGV
ncbi:MAG TPA: lysylphosphatidylglycerol synthase domain-containing protein [Caulobacteraceae bacterium]